MHCLSSAHAVGDCDALSGDEGGTVCRDQRTTLGLLVPWCDSSVQQARLPLLDRISTKQHGGGAHLPLRFVDSVRHTTRSYRLQQQSSSAI